MSTSVRRVGGRGRGRTNPGAERGPILLGGCPTELATQDQAMERLAARLRSDTGPPLAVASANLDHLYHFGRGGRHENGLGAGPASPQWATLLDGAPLVWAARHRTAHSWPRLAGSDLIWPLLSLAADLGVTVGFLGGSPTTHALLRARLERDLPALVVRGLWSPARVELDDQQATQAIADSIREAGVELLVVGLGKPRQELWIDRHAERTGAKLLLAFGASADFVAGVAPRAPEWMRSAGLEWLFRLGHEPRRLARRYLVQGPVAAYRLAGAPDAEDRRGRRSA